MVLSSKYKFNRLIRYGFFFPLDALKSCLFLLISWLFPTNNPEKISRRISVLFLIKFPSKNLIGNLTNILKKTQSLNYKAIYSFFMWPEKLETKMLDGKNSLQSHHKARKLLVQNYLPKGDFILDVGGSGGGVPEGALLNMGYPHSPKKVAIIDLPPEDQFWQHKRPKQSKYMHNLTEVSYVYDGMANLSTFADGSVDGIWSGQSIEHVTKDIAQQFLKEACRVLKPGGWLCLDTPNRKIAKIACRFGYLHPEHFYEYEPNELLAICLKLGFKLKEKKSVSPMPFSKSIKRFCKLELCSNVSVGEIPEDGFSFFLHLVKA